MYNLLAQFAVMMWEPLFYLALLPILVLFTLFGVIPTMPFVYPFLGLLWAVLGCLGFNYFLIFFIRRFSIIKKLSQEVTLPAKIAIFAVQVVAVFSASKLFIRWEASVVGAWIVVSCCLAGIAVLLWLLFQGVAAMGNRWVENSPRLKKLVTGTGIALFLYPLLVVLVFLTWLFFQPFDQVAGREEHTLHAAIKNTCLHDPQQVNCPQHLEEIGKVEPKTFAYVQERSQMKYEYDPATNEYVFIIRRNPKQAAVFSQRLISEGNWGIDYKEYEVDLWGKDHIIDPPFASDWTLPEWEYSPRFR